MTIEEYKLHIIDMIEHLNFNEEELEFLSSIIMYTFTEDYDLLEIDTKEFIYGK